MGKVLIICGVILVIVGILIQFGGKFSFFGKLPGDIKIERDNFTIHFPLATSIVLSIIISLILYFVNKGRS